MHKTDKGKKRDNHCMCYLHNLIKHAHITLRCLYCKSELLCIYCAIVMLYIIIAFMRVLSLVCIRVIMLAFFLG